MITKYEKQRGLRIDKTCNYCGQEFSTLQLKDRAGKELYCSAKCYQLFRSINKKDRKVQNRLYQKKNKYNLSKQDYEKLVEGGVCEICGTGFNATKTGSACVDHDHTTGDVRGVLCQLCNRGLGHFKDDIRLLEKAYKYLEKYVK